MKKDMAEFQSFPASTHERLGYYVYAYVDISNNDKEEVIYIGKGKGNRCFDHLKSKIPNNKTRKINTLNKNGNLIPILFQKE